MTPPEHGEAPASPTREELEDVFRPEEQLSADPETMNLVFETLASKSYDTASAHQYDSWRDADLYRAIANPEHPEGPARDAEVAEYVAELKRRGEARAAQDELEQRLRSQYRI